jgi:hypothetical protein
MTGIQENILVFRHDDGRHSQKRRPLFPDPCAAEGSLVGWQECNILHGQVTDVYRHQHIIVRQQFRRQVKMDANLQHSERRRLRCVNERLTGRIPATTIEPCPVTAQVGIWFTAESPSQHPALAPRASGGYPVADASKQSLNLTAPLVGVE